MKLIPYEHQYQSDCQKIFDANTPKFFDPSEREEFVQFLETPTCTYFVVISDSLQVLGCGGYFISSESRDAGLCWGMVDPQWHRQGIGTFLLEERIQKIKADSVAKRLIMDTSQESVGFFQRFGFTVTKVTEDGYGPGLSQYDLILDLYQFDKFRRRN